MTTDHHLKLDQQICFSLYAASREIIKLYKPILDPHRLTYTQYLAMMVLWEEEKITVKRMGKRLHLDSGTLTPLLKKLEAMGHVSRYRSPEDDRVVIVELTDQGSQLKQNMLDVPMQMASQVQLPIEEALQLKKQLDHLLEQFN